MRTVVVLLALCVSQAMALRADINGDGRVDLQDLSILAEEWLMEEDMSSPDKVQVEGGITPDGVKSLVLSKFTRSEGGTAWGYNVNASLEPTAYPCACYFAQDVAISYLWYKPDANTLCGWVAFQPFSLDIELAAFSPATGSAIVTERRDSLFSGTLATPGKSNRLPVRARGVYMAIRLSNDNLDETFGFERINFNALPAGRAR